MKTCSSSPTALKSQHPFVQHQHGHWRQRSHHRHRRHHCHPQRCQRDQTWRALVAAADPRRGPDVCAPRCWDSSGYARARAQMHPQRLPPAPRSRHTHHRCRSLSLLRQHRVSFAPGFLLHCALVLVCVCWPCHAQQQQRRQPRGTTLQWVTQQAGTRALKRATHHALPAARSCRLSCLPCRPS